MKKTILSIAFLLIVGAGFSQSTYYWVGGTSNAWNLAASWNTSLNGTGDPRTTPNVSDVLIFDGSNIGGATPTTGTVSVSAVPGETISGLILQNGASVTITSASAGQSLGTNISRAAPVVYTTAASGTTGGSNVVSLSSTTDMSNIFPGAIITAASIGGIYSIGGNMVTAVDATNKKITLSQPATGTPSGTPTITLSQPLKLSGTSTVPLAVGDFVHNFTNSNFDQITSVVDAQTFYTTTLTTSVSSNTGTKATILQLTNTTNALSISNSSTLTLSSSVPFVIKFASGAKGTVDGTITSASGNTNNRIVVDADGTASLTFKNGSTLNGGAVPSLFGAVPNANNNNVIFEYGSQVVYSASVGSNGIFGAMLPGSVVKFQKGSTFIWNGSPTGFSSGAVYRELPNLKFNVSVTSFSTPLIDTLIVPAGISVGTTSNSYFALKGDFINEGTFAFNSASAGLPVLFVGTEPQRVLLNGTSGSGTVTYTSTTPNLGGSFQRIIVGPNSTLNLQPSNVDFNTYGTTTVYGTLNFGTNVIKNVHSSLAGAFSPRPFAAGGTTTVSYAVTNSYLITVASLTGFTQGMAVSGTGIPANTVIVSTTSAGNLINLSNPVTIVQGATITSSTNANGATITTANTGGIAASYTLQGTSTYSLNTSPGANYRFDAATTTPFPSSVTSVQANNLTLAADVSSNLNNLTVNGTLDLASNTLTIPESDTLRIASGSSILGSSASKFISLGVNTNTGTRGALKIAGINASTLFPIGTNGNYLPVTITPASTGEDYTISVFNGTTANAQPNGTTIDATKKASMVDAVWTITANVTPTGAVGARFGWPASLEGASFANYANNQIGIASYTSDWEAFASATSDNTNNTATGSFTSFGSFAVGLVNTTLPVKLSNINALNINSTVKLSWQVESEISVDKYIIESSTDGIHFSTIGIVKATASSSYSFVDIQPSTGTNYYRIYAQDLSGSGRYSSVVSIGRSLVINKSISVYPNPIINRTVNIAVYNSLSTNYTVQILDLLGKTIVNKSISHTGGLSNYSIELPSNITTGNYFITVKDITNTVVIKSLLVK